MNSNYETSVVISEYHTNYERLVATILANRDDMAKIKAALKEIDDNYQIIFEYDHRNLFYTFAQHAPMAIFAMLMRKNMRLKYLPIKEDDVVDESQNINMNEEKPSNHGRSTEDKRLMYQYICTMLKSYPRLHDTLG
ncbi:MAG: hypothetical protein GX811_11960, partial [Lentisphaerae bacterium]|nr:hypothetical protein [Lentisphaerota bacterium]